MILEQIYTGCLAEAAYYIESDGEAVVIDPMREPWPYMNRAELRKAKIKYIFETHFHADFVSGHLELAEKTGAKIIYGPGAVTSFDSIVAKDGQEFQVGKIKIRVLHTPGHTPESSSYLLLDEKGKEYALFTGDTLFINEVGRPDLAISTSVTKEDLAGMLYDSLHIKIMTLPGSVIIYPGHGAGSACGKNIGKEAFDTLAHQMQVNYALQKMSKEEFIKKVCADIPPAPAYFAKNALLNKEGYKSLEDVMETGMHALSPDEFAVLGETEAQLILDTRPADEFARGHIPGSINIGLDGQFAPWAASLISDLKTRLLLVTEENKEEETLLRLARVGYDSILGYLKGGITAWEKSGRATAIIERVDAQEPEKYLNSGFVVIDVRKKTEYDNVHLKGVLNYPLDAINEWTKELDRTKNYVLHCAGGYRSMIAASILRSRGFTRIKDVQGGFSAIEKSLDANEIEHGNSSCGLK